MDQELAKQFEEQRIKLNSIELNVKKIHSYLWWTFVISITFFVVPLIIFVIAVPRFIDIYLSSGI